MPEFRNVSIMLGAVTETDSLRETVKTVLDSCNHSDLAEIIIDYPDRITPESMAVLEEFKELDTDVPFNIFKQTRPFMSGIADLMDAAKGSHCILLASDMALDLSCVKEMIELAKVQPDTIFSCSRWMHGCKMYGYGKLRRAANFLAQKYLRILFNAKLTDFTIPVQIAPAELYKSINWEEEGFPFLLEMVLKPLRLGYKFVEIPTNCYPRTDGKSSNSFSQTFAYLRTSLHVRFMKKKDITKN